MTSDTHLDAAMERIDTLIRCELNRARHMQLTAVRQDILAAKTAHMGSPAQLAGMA